MESRFRFTAVLFIISLGRTRNNEEYAAEYERMFAPGYEGTEAFVRKFGMAPERNTSVADYVWLPFRFDKEKPYREWLDE